MNADGRRDRWIMDWNPEDPGWWSRTGRRIANRNLAVSILCEHLGFSVWALWAVHVLLMTPENGFHLDVGQKFLLTSLVTLSGTVLRVPYMFGVSAFGGRTWTTACTLLLLVPTAFTVYVVARPSTPYWVLAAAAIATGCGGATFSSSMTNINLFFPAHRKGYALGLNAGGGNLGVATVQLGALILVAVGGTAHPEYLPLLYVPVLVVAGLLAARFMDNLADVRSRPSARLAVLTSRHSWVMSLLYLGTFGSFIGYGFAFGLVLQQQFGRTPFQAATVTFLGPLLGSLSRPVGGWLADRLGGARVTLWNFGLMLTGTGVLLVASASGSLAVFVTGFILLFVFAGVGNGSVYKMIPWIFATEADLRIDSGGNAEAARTWARDSAGSLIGICGAIGAAGGVPINLVFRESYSSVSSGWPAFTVFAAFYALCMAVTYQCYLRRKTPARVPVPAAHSQAGR